jgi:hypothetical protein
MIIIIITDCNSKPPAICSYSKQNRQNQEQLDEVPYQTVSNSVLAAIQIQMPATPETEKCAVDFVRLNMG